MMLSVNNLKELETDLMDAIGLGDGVIQVGRINPFVPNRQPQGVFARFNDGHEIEILVREIKVGERKMFR